MKAIKVQDLKVRHSTITPGPLWARASVPYIADGPHEIMFLVVFCRCSTLGDLD